MTERDNLKRETVCELLNFASTLAAMGGPALRERLGVTLDDGTGLLQKKVFDHLLGIWREYEPDATPSDEELEVILEELQILASAGVQQEQESPELVAAREAFAKVEEVQARSDAWQKTVKAFDAESGESR